jgi:hypothetical protein
MAKTYLKTRTFGIEGVMPTGINVGDTFVLVNHDGFPYSCKERFIRDLLGVIIPTNGTPFAYAMSLTRLTQTNEFETSDALSIADVAEGTAIKFTAKKNVKIKDFDVNCFAYKIGKKKVEKGDGKIVIGDFSISLDDFVSGITRNTIPEEPAKEEAEE